MELRQMRYFVEVADALSFTRAAERLHMSQPPVSRQIARLEEEIGAALFHRTKQSVALTEAGRAFYDQARATLASAQAALTAARRAAAGHVGRLALGFGGLSAYWWPQVMAEFRARSPSVELVLHPLQLAHQRAALLEDRIDVGMVVLPLEHADLAAERFRCEPLWVALPEGHALAAHRSLSLSQLADCDFVMVPWTRGHGFGRLTMRICSRAGFVPRVVQEAEPMESVVGMVGAGVGLAIVPAIVSQLPVSRVVYRPIRERYARAEIGIAWSKGNHSPVLKHFVDVARRVVRAHARQDVG
ncbi:LysR family transcriptional regulator [Ramlibacter sp. AW1]|uniref:LysR family transcriptional regulator n=1 Tax=Ramlibacter aurantiacus TaxID=2801330 RepID=A0A936ZFU1_9BURK|nr:LysR family transcriptional regulator [Ramlibacter aurantiacus]MBL0420714.1 LysR family transcriptional regulator [Ramlibacter aurantiacus]